MGKIGEWEDIAEKIAESLFFEAVMSFEEGELMKLIFPAENEGYTAKGVSEGEKKAEKSAAANLSEDIKRITKMPEAEYDAAGLLEEAERAISRLWEEKAEEPAAYYSGEKENTMYIRAESLLTGNEEESAAEYDLSIGRDLIEAEGLKNMYEKLFSEEAMSGEFGADEAQLPKMIYEAAEKVGSEAYINEAYGAEKIGRSGARRIIESTAERGSGASREVKIEMVNNNNISSKVDIDDVADMLTMRICDIMNRSADGIY